MLIARDQVNYRQFLRQPKLGIDGPLQQLLLA